MLTMHWNYLPILNVAYIYIDPYYDMYNKQINAHAHNALSLKIVTVSQTSYIQTTFMTFGILTGLIH